MKHTVYKTTNNINGKYYIGAHSTKIINDDYFGSGIALKKAIDKYGIENFSKEILFIFETKEEMFKMEREIVSEEVANDKMSYNLKIGGYGGWPNNAGENNPNFGKELWKKGKTEEEIIEINKKRASHGEKNGMFGKTHNDMAKQRIIEGNKLFNETDEGKEKLIQSAIRLSEIMTGVPKSEEQKEKMSESAKKRWTEMEIVKCLYCGKEGKIVTMKRYHFEKCKFKNNLIEVII
jgi:hypothetical protein